MINQVLDKYSNLPNAERERVSELTVLEDGSSKSRIHKLHVEALSMDALPLDILCKINDCMVLFNIAISSLAMTHCKLRSLVRVDL